MELKIVSVYQWPVIQIELLVLACWGDAQNQFPNFPLLLLLSDTVRSLSLIKNELVHNYIPAFHDPIPLVWENSAPSFCYWNHTLSLRANFMPTPSQKLKGPHSKAMFPNLGAEIHPLLFKIKSQINRELTWIRIGVNKWKKKNKCAGKKENTLKYVFH